MHVLQNGNRIEEYIRNCTKRLKKLILDLKVTPFFDLMERTKKTLKVENPNLANNEYLQQIYN